MPTCGSRSTWQASSWRPTRSSAASTPTGWRKPGAFAPGLVYVKTPDGGYILKLSRGADRVTLTSNDSLSAFLSPSLSRLVQRRGK